MLQGFTPLVQFLLLLVLMGFAMAGLHLWPSVHVALSNASVFVTYSADSNMTASELSMALVDLDKNVTVLTRRLPFNRSEGILEFNCTSFSYAGNFSFRLDQWGHQGVRKSTSSWWSPVLHIQWPTFHFGVERANNNHSSGAFQVSVSTNVDFHFCPNINSSLYLEVSYMEHNQIGKNTIDKVQKRTTHSIQVVKSQHVGIRCALMLTEADFIQVALKSHYTQQDIKSSGPLYLSRIFSYKLMVENIYRSGCEGTVSVRLLYPPCTVTTGKVLLYKEASSAAKQETLSQLAFHFLTRGENETEFNCSQFDLGQKKYCFHYARIYSQSSSLAQTCIIVQRNAVEMWGPWQTWSGCSVTCGDGVRERVRECLLPPGGGMRCTGMVREQSLCSLEDCTDVLSPVSVPPPPAVNSILGGNLVVVAGIVLCLAVILVTILITVWRKLCHAPKCSSARPDSIHSPGGRKNSDEASICGRSIQRPSFSESMGAVQKGQSCPVSIRAASDKGVLACQQSFSLPMSFPQDPERLSPSGQKILPPIFGYRLAQQQLKEMKKKGLKEATQVYHVSQSPVDDAMVEATASTSAGLTPVPQDLESQEGVGISPLHKSLFTESTWPHRNSATLPDRLSSKVDFMLATPKAVFSDRDRRQERTADWVAMVERNRLSLSKNPNFRRTSSFNESNLQQLTKPRSFRERSMTQVAPRQLPEGSCRTKAWEHTIPELEDWSQAKCRISDISSDCRQQPRVNMPSFSKSKPVMVNSGTSVLTTNRVTDRHGVGWAPSFEMDRVERAEQNWNRRGPSPIQRNILARKLREANSSASHYRQRSSTFSSFDQSKSRCRSLPLSADYSSSSYGLTEDEQRMMDLSGYLGEEDGTEITKDLRLT